MTIDYNGCNARARARVADLARAQTTIQTAKSIKVSFRDARRAHKFVIKAIAALAHLKKKK